MDSRLQLVEKHWKHFKCSSVLEMLIVKWIDKAKKRRDMKKTRL